MSQDFGTNFANELRKRNLKFQENNKMTIKQNSNKTQDQIKLKKKIEVIVSQAISVKKILKTLIS